MYWQMLIKIVFCSHVENIISDKFGHVAKEIPKQSVEGATWLLYIAYSKIQDQIDKLREELLNKKELGRFWKFSASLDVKRC